MWTTFLAACGGCTPSPSTQAVDAEPQTRSATGTYVYLCDVDVRFVVRVQEDSVRLSRGVNHVTLPQVRAASGTRYGNDSITFWSKGLEARLETPADTVVGCHGTPADTPWEASRLLGYELRAVGQEPGWMVEVESDRRMHVLADYGQIEFEVAAPIATEGPNGEMVYRAPSGEHRVEVRVLESPCQDTMSGERFPLTVHLQLDGTEYHGCGMRL